jgi:predicted enzyme related to lactoylglutathione lyase
MEEIKSAINWFEIPTIDFDRAVRFYSEIYSFDMPTRDMGHVRMGFFKHQPADWIGGTIVSGDAYAPSKNGVKLYLNGGDDLSPVLERVTNAGGTIIKGETEIGPGIGYSAMIDDTEGNRIYLHSMN